MQLDVLKTIEKTKGKINPHYDMTIDGAILLIDRNKTKLDLAFDAFVLGYAQGMKAQKKAGASK